ncbi:hypothetical protein [Nocardia asteroides]|uniref:hypothetical protein n=1 Tax=Nocardia asteroides TaxID=1824 RepID=UPI001E4DEB76|nr:hypothetical protein [Nocardia asteroides]UGT62666.1 hypothetical protein LTT61_04780 [Nocardia asteroides]
MSTIEGWESEGMPGEQGTVDDDGHVLRLGPGGRVARTVAVRPGSAYTLSFEITTEEPAAAATVSVHGDGEILESRPFAAGTHALGFTAPGAEVTLRVLGDGGRVLLRDVALRPA